MDEYSSILDSNDFVREVNKINFPEFGYFSGITVDFFNNLKLQFRIEYKKVLVPSNDPVIDFVEGCDLARFQIGSLEFLSKIDYGLENYAMFGIIDDINYIAIDRKTDNVVVLSEQFDTVVQRCSVNQISFLNAIYAVKELQLEILKDLQKSYDLVFMKTRVDEITVLAGGAEFNSFYRSLFGI